MDAVIYQALLNAMDRVDEAISELIAIQPELPIDSIAGKFLDEITNAFEKVENYIYPELGD